MSKKRVKVAVTGAAGQIGYSLLFRIASGAMLGKDTEIDLQLLELEPALNALNGVRMELEDCAFPLLRSVTCTTDQRVAFKEADWCLLVGSVPRKDGMERKDLLKINGGIFTTQGKNIAEVAKTSVKTLVVGNPCNTNAWICAHSAIKANKNISPKQFFAMTMLDQNRAMTQLAQKANVPVSEIKDCVIWGNHSTTMYPDFYNTKINGKSAALVINDEAWLKGTFMETVQKRGAAIIKARGLSSAASAANAAIDTVRFLEGDAAPGKAFSVAVMSDGNPYGIPADLMYSFPIESKNGSWDFVKGWELNDFSKEKMALTQKELEEEKSAVKELLV